MFELIRFFNWVIKLNAIAMGVYLYSLPTHLVSAGGQLDVQAGLSMERPNVVGCRNQARLELASSILPGVFAMSAAGVEPTPYLFRIPLRRYKISNRRSGAASWRRTWRGCLRFSPSRRLRRLINPLRLWLRDEQPWCSQTEQNVAPGSGRLWQRCPAVRSAPGHRVRQLVMWRPRTEHHFLTGGARKSARCAEPTLDPAVFVVPMSCLITRIFCPVLKPEGKPLNSPKMVPSLRPRGWQRALARACGACRLNSLGH